MNLDNKGILATILFHALFLLLVIIFGYSTPLPLPAEQGIMMSFGTTVSGRGDVEPLPQPVVPVSRPAPTATSERQYMTQDIEDAPTLPSQKKTEVKKTTDNQRVRQSPQPVKPQETQTKTEPQVNPLNLYRGAGNESSGSEGSGSQDGNQGSEDGGTGSNHFVGGGQGMGIGFDLTGRSQVSLPYPEYRIQKEGIVVVQITVGRDGRVTEALAGVKGSTTLDSYLLDAARKAALAATFNSKADAPMFQKGTITYHFKLK